MWRTKSAVLHILVIELFELLEKWDDLNAERPFMQIAAANRRNQILASAGNLRMTSTAITTGVAQTSLSKWISISMWT